MTAVGRIPLRSMPTAWSKPPRSVGCHAERPGDRRGGGVTPRGAYLQRLAAQPQRDRLRRIHNRVLKEAPMSILNVRPVKAEVVVTMDDGRVYRFDLVDTPDRPLVAELDWQRDVVEVPPEEHGLLWRVHRPGTAYVDVHLNGVVVDPSPVELNEEIGSGVMKVTG